MTMSPLDCLNALEAQGVRIYLTNDRLQIIAPKDVLTEEYKEILQGSREEIIEFIRKRKTAHVPDGPGPVVPADRNSALPLSFGQERLWFLAQLEPDSVEYNAPMAVRLGGLLDVAALSGALGALVERHEVLRTRLVAGTDGVPYQVIDPVPAAFEVPMVDVSSADDPVVMAREWLARDAARPFDLAAGPAFRATLARLGPDDHILSLARHHIVSDESSARILRHELQLLYASYRRGEPMPLAPLLVQYADFAVWQREWLTSEVLEPHLEYWRDRLAGAPVSELPTDRPRPPVRSSAGAVIEFEVPPEVTDGLRAVSRGANATMFMTLLAAFNVLLSRYSGRDDIVVGAPVASRDRAEIEGLIGFFINTLVLRTDLSGDPTFAELLTRVRAGALDAYAHRDLPFEHLVDALEIERDRSRNPVCEVLFNFISAEETEQAGAGEEGDEAGEVAFDFDLRSILGEIGGPQTVSAKSDLELTLAEAGGGLAGAMEYSTALFDRATVERFVRHLLVFLEAAAGGADRHLSELPIVTSGECREMERWNDRVSPLPAVGGVHELVAERAAALPDDVAVVSGGESLTYGELEVRANRLARYLRDRGVGPETVVGLCLERGVDLVVALLAVWKAGGAYLPLDPEYPADRLTFMLADGGVPVLVGTESAVEDLPAGRILSVIVDDPVVSAGVAALDGSPLGVPVSADQLAYVMYTSGSTGRPKGVQVAHRGVVNLALAQAEVFGVGAGDVALQFASFGFDAAVSEICVALAAGARVVVATEGERGQPERLAALVRGAGVDVATLPPSLLGVLSPGDLDGLRTLVAAGEALSPESARVWGARHRLLNAYGPTETTVCASVSEPIDPGSSGVPPIGRPFANTRTVVLDAALSPVPVGVPGEVFVGGVGLARGYRGRPELTAECFVADPFAADGSRLYRTGDVARWRADGQLEFVGRADHQVKVRGFRVEPGEIEAALTAHWRVRAAVVVADEDHRLVAYVVPDDPAEGIPSAGELRELLRDRLPEYMVPAVFVELAALPLSPNGKVDRAALPTPDGTRPELTGGFVAPRTATEEVLAGIWGEILGLDQVGVTDGFFELGGHSLLATRVISRIRAAFEMEVPLAALFNEPTVAGLAGVIDERAGSAGLSAVPPIVPADRDRPLPLSFSQQRLWFLAQLEPGSVEYNTPMPVRLSGAVDVDALTAALGALTERHDVLRTRLVAGPDGVAHQVIDPPAPFPLPVVDLSDADDPMRAAEDWIERDVATPFDLATGPLFRATLVRIAERENVLALAMHHIVSDEWSEAILRRELDALYDACRAGLPSPLPPLPVQYADFAVWQRQWLTGDVIEGHLAFWRERLAGAPVLELPTDRPRPSVRSSAGAAIDFVVPEPVAHRLRTLSRDAGATMFMTLLGVFDVLLARYAGQDDIVVGTPIANRTRTEIEGLIGCFINTLVIRTDLSGDPTFAELLARVRSGALDAYAHQDLPFEQLVDELVTERDRSRTPVFQALFNYLTEEITPPDRTEEAADAEAGVTTRCDLRLIFAEASGGGLLGTVQYSTALFDRSTVERMASHLLELLEAVAGGADRPLSRLSVVPVAERRQMAEWNDTATELPAVGGMHELVAARAARCLDAVAVRSDGESLIYEDLEISANRLARYLREAGVGPETVVGLCLGPGIDVIVSLLAIWKAGGAYLPLDPAYPADRLAYMLADGGVSMLVGALSAVDEIPAGRIRTVIVDDPAVAAAVAAQDETAPEVTVSPDQVAYVIYTSGSTGRPKGVQVTHRGLINYVTGVPGRIALGGVGSRYALLQPAATDFGNTMIFSCLVTGGTLHLVDPDVVTDPNEVADYLTRHAIDYVKIVPSHLAALSSEHDLARLLPGRTLVLGGEAAPRTWVARLLDAVPGRAVFNHYGPTETTIGVATTRLVGAEPGSVPIGSPIANTRFHVLDRCLEPVPVGVPGELFVGGACVARGYLNRPDLTGERFVADPFARDGSRLYRTGDKVRWRADGRLEFLGRVDQQVKIRGFRIEPGEIEAHLTAHAEVNSAVVVADGDDEGRRLVAYLTPSDAEVGVPATAELRKFLLRRLPEHMVPAAFVELAALPLTPNGKLDRSALPAPDTVRPDLADAFVPPGTYKERLLAEVWADVLGLDQVGTTDNFFELGGHSLLVTQIVARVRTTGHDISVGEFFDHPTVGRLAPLLRVRVDGTALPETRSAFQIRNGDLTPPLFFVHPASGSVTDFAEIAGRLARGQQAYGLQSLGLAEGDLPLETIEEMASAYLDDVRVLQPDGPYLFAAWSMGCYVALEMARQIVATGGEIGGLFLIGPPYHQDRSEDWIRMEWERARVLLSRIDETINAEPGTRLPEDVEEYLLGSWDQDDDGVAAVRAGDKQRLRLGRALLTNFWAGVRYQNDPRRAEEPYDGRVVMFVPRDDLDERQRIMIEQWREECSQEPQVVHVPGKHRTVIYDDGAEAVGTWLSEEIVRLADS